MRARSALRAVKLGSGETTRWKTSSGGFFVEPIQRPDKNVTDVVIMVHMSRSAYRVLELLFDDVSAYIARLLESHVNGLVKSAKLNRERTSR